MRFEILQVEETAHAPLRGASPQFVQSVSEKEKDLPVAMDCTTLALVDDAPSQSTSLLAENQDCEVEPRDCHEDTGSAAPVAQNEKSLNFAIANQTPKLVEQDHSAMLWDFQGIKSPSTIMIIIVRVGKEKQPSAASPSPFCSKFN